MSHPPRLPDKAALGPDTNSVQSPSLSSIQRPSAFFLTMCETLGGGKNLGSKTWIMLGIEQETKARCGEPANTTSAGVSKVLSVATVFPALASTILTESEM